jgi:hypothetical protein
MSKRGVICSEPKGICSGCSLLEELRPYGANGEEICYDCAMKDMETTAKRFRQHVLGEGFDA